MKDYVYKKNSLYMRDCNFQDMVMTSTPVKYETMQKHCDIKTVLNKVIPDLFPHNRNKCGYVISYNKSMIRSVPCYYVMCQGIAYVFVKKED
jgi:hypothetical protein